MPRGKAGPIIVTDAKASGVRNKIVVLGLCVKLGGRVIMFFESLLKHKGVLQEMASAEALKYQKCKPRGFTRVFFVHGKAQSSKENLFNTQHT